ncbi:hypothetical protein F2Q70_00031885 [Brassica cretica]|uniref:Uncharacterized protein n=1 Tax=Brassica cretica TaxID=69181 RepID=A0A8S9FIV5_BRACR|nr:hypothetical protein F2Q70_00031885 [Brassica cretica]
MLYKRVVIQEGCACITRLRIGCNLLSYSSGFEFWTSLAGLTGLTGLTVDRPVLGRSDSILHPDFRFGVCLRSWSSYLLTFHIDKRRASVCWIVWRLRPALVDQMDRSLEESVNRLRAVLPSTISAVFLAREWKAGVHLAMTIACSLGETDE